MKKFLCSALLLLFAGTVYSAVNPGVDYLRTGILKGIFFSQYKKQETRLRFDAKIDFGYDAGKVTEFRILNRCQLSPAFIYKDLYKQVSGTEIYGHEGMKFDADFNRRFKDLFGQEILKAKIPTVQKRSRGEQVFRMYNPEAFEAAFRILYRKPDQAFKGFKLQEIYDASLKQYLRESAETVVAVLAKKKEFEKFSETYLRLAKTNAKFDGQKFSEDVKIKLLGDERPPCQLANDRIVGMMLRRQTDGTLPVLIKILKTILADYDPEFYRQIQGKL